MAQISVDENKLKLLLKETFIELLEQKKELFQNMITAAIEDIAMVHAIKEGEKSGKVSKSKVFKVLKGKQ